MKEFLLKIITLLHIYFVIFVIITPFLDSNYLLMLHAIFIPFLILHWLCNDNTCVLTIIERKLRTEMSEDPASVEDDCVTCKLIEPIYDFKKNHDGFTKIIYTITIVLWLISVSRLAYKYNNGEISSYKDLFAV
jgi:hypothetical protein